VKNEIRGRGKVRGEISVVKRNKRGFLKETVCRYGGGGASVRPLVKA